MTSRIGTGADARRSRTDNSGSTRAKSRASASLRARSTNMIRSTASPRRAGPCHEAEAARADSSVHVGGIGRRIGADSDQRFGESSRGQPAGVGLRDRRQRQPDRRRHRPTTTGPASRRAPRRAPSAVGRPAHRLRATTRSARAPRRTPRCPSVVDGSIPTNKSDLINFGGYRRRPRRATVPLPLLAPRPGAVGHHEHGLRVQPVQRRVVPTA